MFTGFHEDTLQYWKLMEESNSKATFREHQQLYRSGLKEPLEALYYELANYFSQLDYDLSTDKRRCISSPYNDARFCGDRPMKEYCYVRFQIIKADKYNRPGFYFDASRSCYRYGLQIYHLNARGMEQIRQKLLRERSRAERMIRNFEKKRPMELQGMMLKRAYAPGEKPALQKWLNMRTIFFSREAPIRQEFMERW